MNFHLTKLALCGGYYSFLQHFSLTAEYYYTIIILICISPRSNFYGRLHLIYRRKEQQKHQWNF